MHFFVISLLMVFAVATVSAESLHSSYRFRLPTVERGIDGGILSVEGLENFSVSGLPVVPYMPVRWMIPENAVFDSLVVRVLSCTTLTVAQLKRGSPVIPALPTGFDEGTLFRGSAYPGKYAEAVTVQIKRGVRMVMGNIFPVQASLLRNVVTAARGVEVTVHFTRRSGRSTALPKIASGGLCGNGDTVPYVIITSDSIKNATGIPFTFDSLLVQRKKQGLKGCIVTVESIDGSYTGADKQEKIRNFIRDAYSKWKTEYVVLGGDINVVPQRYVMPNGYFAPDGNVDPSHIPTDAYYACLDGGFNRDGDTCWAEATDGDDSGMVDILQEVYIGRISGKNALKVSNHIGKILAYERIPGSNTYMKRAFFAGESLGFGGASQYADSSLDELRFGSTKYYTTVGFNSASGVETVPLYESPGKLFYNSDIYLRVMRDSFSVYVSYGHSYPRKMMKLNSSDTLFFGVKQQCFPILYSEGCEAGMYDYPTDDCVSEAFTTGSKRGFCAILSNSRVSYAASNSTDGAIHRYARHFWNTYFSGNSSKLGVMLAETREANASKINSFAMRHCQFTMHLFGDPFMSVRMKGEDDVSVETGTISSAMQSLRMVMAPSPFTGKGIVSVKGLGDAKGDFLFSVYDMRGRLIKSEVVNHVADAKEAVWKINEKLAAGIYTVKFMCGHKSSAANIVVLP
ncbi:MAG: hypothetical protein JNL74_04525 [Fibrobacteres bacterium]|nr:hypothetical protein [Fibrobacterota bacterium]